MVLYYVAMDVDVGQKALVLTVSTVCGSLVLICLHLFFSNPSSSIFHCIRFYARALWEMYTLISTSSTWGNLFVVKCCAPKCLLKFFTP